MSPCSASYKVIGVQNGCGPSRDVGARSKRTPRHFIYKTLSVFSIVFIAFHFVGPLFWSQQIEKYIFIYSTNILHPPGL